MIKCAGIVGALLLTACTASSNNQVTPPQAQRVVSFVATDSDLKVAYTASDHQQDLQNIIDGYEPTDYQWVLITIAASVASPDTLPGGLQLDLTDPASGIRFTQQYYDVCNPAKQDFNSCLLFETYSSGMAGLTGSLQVRADSKTISGSIDITWQGITDRFGDPAQLYKHGTLSDFQADTNGVVP